MTDQKLPDEVVEIDSSLERSATRANQELAKHRWHWTLDESNPGRVSYTTYASAVGRAPSSIRAHARGYATWLEDPDGGNLQDRIELANMSPTRQIVARELAKVYDVSFSTLRERYATQLHDVYELVEKRVAAHSESWDDATRAVVDFHQKAVDAREAERKNFREQHSLRFVGVENELTKARNALYKALHEAQNVQWSEQEQTILNDSLRRLRSMLDLVDLSISGSAEVDWDAELAKLGVA